MPLPTNLSYLGIAKEVTKGTGVAPVDYIPVDANSLKPIDKVNYLIDQALRGSMVDAYGEIAGPVWSEWGFGGPIFPDTFGYLLAGILGDVTTTGASAPFTHTMAVQNGAAAAGQPKAYTLTDFYGLTSGTPARQFAGMQFSEVDVKFTADGLLHHDTKATGFASTLVAKPTAAFTAVTAVPAWRGALTIAGASKTFLVDGQINLKRNVTPIITAAAQSPYAVWVGPLMVDGQVTFVHEDDSELVRYLTNTQPAFVIDFQQGAGAALTEVKLTMTNCAYIEGIIDRGKDYVASTYKLKAVANTTDIGSSGGYGLVKGVIQSAKAASTYV